MANGFLQTYFTRDVLDSQQKYFGRSQQNDAPIERDPLGAEEVEFITRRDSFYMATVNSDGWPYVQHRGGPAGFLRVLDAYTLGFADFRGNRQLVSTGNVISNDRVALFLMDYRQRERLKINGHVHVLDAREHTQLADGLAPPLLRAKTERIFLIETLSFDWNCSQYITPRYTSDEMETIVAALHTRIAELEEKVRTGSGLNDSSSA